MKLVLSILLLKRKPIKLVTIHSFLVFFVLIVSLGACQQEERTASMAKAYNQKQQIPDKIDFNFEHLHYHSCTQRRRLYWQNVRVSSQPNFITETPCYCK